MGAFCCLTKPTVLATREMGKEVCREEGIKNAGGERRPEGMPLRV